MAAKPKQAEKDGAPAKPPAIAGLPQGGAAPAAGAGEAEVRLLPDPAGRRGAGDREGAPRARARQAPAGRSTGSGQGRLFHPGGLVPEPADADNQKARLAILGFESSVEPANLPDKGTWYRVRLGPYTKVEEINKVRQALAQNGIDASLIKVKDQQ